MDTDAPWLVTGLGGTLAPKLADVLGGAGHSVQGWDRSAVPPDDPAAVSSFLSSRPWAGIAHLGMGSAQWAGQLAGWAGEHELPFVFTSSVMVFGETPDGPHHPGDERTSQEDYGRYKMECEDAVAAANPAGLIARIGWQIDANGQGNNMLAQLDEQARAAGGVVRASRSWRPATSWMPDTARAIVGALAAGRSGVVHLDSNAAPAWSFVQVVRHVSAVAGRDWQVEEHDELVYDQRLVGDEDLIRPLG